MFMLSMGMPLVQCGDNCELLDKMTYISGATAEFYKL